MIGLGQDPSISTQVLVVGAGEEAGFLSFDKVSFFLPQSGRKGFNLHVFSLMLQTYLTAEICKVSPGLQTLVY